MTDQELFAYEREHHGDPYMTLVRAKGMQRVARAVLACWGGPEEGRPLDPGGGAASPASRSCFRPTLLSLSPTAGATLALYSSQNRGAGRMNDVYIIESWFDERLNKCNVHARPDRRPKLQVQQHDSAQLNALGQWWNSRASTSPPNGCCCWAACCARLRE